jgi:hypothetical protein
MPTCAALRAAVMGGEVRELARYRLLREADWRRPEVFVSCCKGPRSLSDFLRPRDLSVSLDLWSSLEKLCFSPTLRVSEDLEVFQTSTVFTLTGTKKQSFLSPLEKLRFSPPLRAPGEFRRTLHRIPKKAATLSGITW